MGPSHFCAELGVPGCGSRPVLPGSVPGRPPSGQAPRHGERVRSCQGVPEGGFRRSPHQSQRAGTSLQRCPHVYLHCGGCSGLGGPWMTACPRPNSLRLRVDSTVTPSPPAARQEPGRNPCLGLCSCTCRPRGGPGLGGNLFQLPNTGVGEAPLPQRAQPARLRDPHGFLGIAGLPPPDLSAFSSCVRGSWRPLCFSLGFARSSTGLQRWGHRPRGP